MLLGGLGLVVATRLQLVPLARWLALATVVVAVGGATLALWALLLRERDVRVNDLQAGQDWYQSQFRRAGLVRLEGRLLLAGLVTLFRAQTDVR